MATQPEETWKEDREEGGDGHLFIGAKKSSLPIIDLKKRLPVYKYKYDILFLLEKYRTLVIQGETGCGKSTQVPQYLMETGYRVVVTEPRRIAAISLAERVAQETHSHVGQAVGYCIGFDDMTTQDVTQIKFVTEGILLREMMSDPLLSHYDVIVLDEVHERTLDMDLLLCIMKKVMKKRKDLKLVISSATLDAEKLVKYFGKHDSYALSIEGKSFPIETYHLQTPVPDYVTGVYDAVVKIHQQEGDRNGDILCFLPGVEEVNDVIDKLREKAMTNLNYLPLHASLSSKDQHRVFLPVDGRKVIVSTNVAETSITLPNITFVVDSGFEKVRVKNSLVTISISAAVAKQRAGRSGRTRPGKVFRLYTEEEYKSFPSFSVPPIRRCLLHPLMLRMLSLGFDNLFDLDFLDLPPLESVTTALEMLNALKAIDGDGRLTQEEGMRMAEFTCDPMLSKMVLDSEHFGCTEEIVTIASMMQVRDIFQVSSSGQRVLDARKKKYELAVAEGDLITQLNIYNLFVREGRTRSWADRHFLNYRALLRAGELRGRFVSLMKRFKIPSSSAEGDITKVTRCIVSGLFPNAAHLSTIGDGRIYNLVKDNTEVTLHPSSVVNLSAKPPQWVIFSEIVHTSKAFIKDVVAIKPEWLYELAPHYYQFGTDRQMRESLMTT